MALADLNNDGYDDFAFSSSSTLDIYYGKTSILALDTLHRY